MNNRILITGGLGYVGGRVACYLADHTSYHLALGTRRVARETPVWLKRGMVFTLDVMNDESIASACEGVRAVVHLAALNEIDSERDPEAALRVNSLGSLRLLRTAVQAGVKRFIYVSTAHVYGMPLTGLLTEKSLARPAHPYAITHRVAEDFVLSAHDKGEVIGVVLRLSNGFGVPERPNVDRWTLLVNDLCRQAVTMGRLVMRSSGLQRRDFIPLSDVARAVAHFIELPPDRCGDGLFNLGGEAPLSIIEVAEMIASRCEVLFGKRPSIERPSPSPGESVAPLNYCIAKLKGTGFRLEGDFIQEIDDTLVLCRRAFAAA